MGNSLLDERLPGQSPTQVAAAALAAMTSLFGIWKAFFKYLEAVLVKFNIVKAQHDRFEKFTDDDEGRSKVTATEGKDGVSGSMFENPMRLESRDISTSTGSCDASGDIEMADMQKNGADFNNGRASGTSESPRAITATIIVEH